MEDMRVRDLIIPGSNCWDIELIEEYFNEADLKEISSIPLPPSPCSDVLIWHYSRNEEYTVRSAYRKACDLTINEQLGVEGRWKSIWKLKVPPKVKVFLWRTAHNTLPTKENLLRRGVMVGGECGLCKIHYETLWHLFITCPFAAGCWKEAGLEQQIMQVSDRNESFFDWVSDLLSCRENEVRVGMILWQIWRDRNVTVWKDLYPSPTRSCTLAACCRSEWLEAQNSVGNLMGRRSGQIRCKGWHDLQEGWIKCGVDAAFFENENTTGIGIILRNHQGNFIAAKALKLLGKLRVEEGEIMGIREALSWVKELGFMQVLIKSDCKVACDAIISHDTNNTELGLLALLCRREMELTPEWKVKYIGRDLNEIAHKIARASINVDTLHVWNEPPSFVEGLLHISCLCN